MSSPTGPTPPPPPMQAAPVPPAAPDSAGPALSEPQRLVNVFIAPSKTFADLQRNPSWWKPWAISAVFTLLFGIVAVQKVDISRFLQQQIDKSPAAQQRLEQLPPEQRERGMAIQVTMTKVGFYGYGLVILIGGILFAAILMVVFNFVFGAEVPFQRALAVVFYSFFTWNLATILLTLSILVSADANTIDLTNPMPTNPAFFMDPQGNKFIYALVSSFDVFKIWAVILLGLGFATASSNRKPTKGTAITATFVIYAVVVLAGAAWKSIF